jgi:hypothetical protein
MSPADRPPGRSASPLALDTVARASARRYGLFHSRTAPSHVNMTHAHARTDFFTLARTFSRRHGLFHARTASSHVNMT